MAYTTSDFDAWGRQFEAMAIHPDKREDIITKLKLANYIKDILEQYPNEYDKARR
jgi:hypothetical protein